MKEDVKLPPRSKRIFGPSRSLQDLKQEVKANKYLGTKRSTKYAEPIKKF